MKNGKKEAESVKCRWLMIDDVRCKGGNCDKLGEFVRSIGAASCDVPWMQPERKELASRPLQKSSQGSRRYSFGRCLPYLLAVKGQFDVG